MTMRKDNVLIPNVRLTLIRAARRVSMVELAEKVGISASAIYSYERGLMNPRRPNMANKIAAAVDVNGAWLFQTGKPSNRLERAIDQLIDAILEVDGRK